jgi:LuxR family maltose regulon positive regulatory protein
MAVRGMSPSLAKLSRPRLARVHPRERLFQRLDECLEHPAVWVSGVAGAGKTTLIASYLSARKLPALWYHVDGSDIDPAACCHYLRLAATRMAPRACSQLPVLPPTLNADEGPFFSSFFAALYACSRSLRILVVDNSHEALSSPGFRKLLRAAIREAPDKVRVIITSRTRPSGDSAHLRANGYLAVLDAEELSFTEDESIAVQRLAAAGGQTRSIDQMRHLHQVTGGWPAGVKLLLQLEDLDSLPAANPRLANGSALFEFMAKEIFDRQSEEVRGVLLKLAYLPRISPAMVCELVASPEAAQILATMQADNIFTSGHGVEGGFHYRFHPLLREFLLLRAESALPSEERERIVRQAAALLAQSGEVDAAAQVLISGRQWDELQRLLLEHAANLVDHGWHRTLSVWLEAFPEANVTGDPWLSYWQGVALLPFDPPAGQRRLYHSYALFRERHLGEGSFLAWSANVDLICLEWADFSKLDHWLDEAKALLGEFGAPADKHAARFAASMFGALLFRRPQDLTIHVWAKRLLLHIEACVDPNQRIQLACNLQIHYTVGVGLNVELDRLMKAIEPPAGTRLAPLTGALLWALRSMQHWSRGESEQAAAAAESGSKLARENHLRMWDFMLGALLVYARLNNGERSRGRAALARLEKSLDSKRKIDVAHFHYLACLASLSDGEGAPALAHIETANAISHRYGGPQQEALGELARAQALHAVGRTLEARPVLEHGRQIALAMESGILCFQADLCAALFALDAGDDDACAKALESAFTVGAARDYLNHNSFRPAVMARLCAFALAHDIAPDYARRLIRERKLKPPALEVDGWPWPVRIYTLGRFSLVVDGRPIAETSPLQHKPVELLQALLSFGGRQVAIARLIDCLWPEAESKSGRGAFDTALLRLRRLLGHDDSLIIEGGRLTLNPMLCWVDVWCFERLLGAIEEGLLHPGDSDTEDLLARNDTLLGFYHGDFLEHESAHPWASRRQERLRDRLLNVVDRIGRRLQAGQFWDRAVTHYRRAIILEPLAEPFYRRLMVCLQRLGERAEALRVYAQCRKALSGGLQATPSPATEAIREAIESLSRLQDGFTG